MAQCSNCNSNFPGGTASTTSSTLTTVTTAGWGGDYSYYNVVAGQTYTWQTCGSTYDTQLTLFQNVCNGTYLAYNDDACGTQSIITWTATFTGTVALLLSQYPCTTGTTSATIQWACTTCSAAPPITVTGCTGTFYDLGGTGNYSNSESQVWTFCPDNPGSLMQINFTTWSPEPGNNNDQLLVYNGNSTAAPYMLGGDGLNPLGLVQASPPPTNTSGCLTFDWSSDGATTAAGWVATINCIDPCQDVVAVWNGSTPAAVWDAVDGAYYINICQGGTVTFNATANYPENNTSYTQSNATSTFHWDFDDGTSSNGQSVSHTFPTSGGYDIDLTVTDVNGCVNANDIGVRVRVSTTPDFTGTTVSDNTICVGQCATLTGVVTPVMWQYPSSQTLAGTTFLPDGSGVSYTTGLTFDEFNPGQTVTSINDIAQICLTMEHSYLGDLDVFIECPNGSTTSLFYTYGTGAGYTYLGEATDFSTTPGDGYQYCFDPASTAGTFVELVTAGAPTYSYTDNDGNVVTAHPYIPAGTYEADGLWTNLIGCPLNGTWTIHVTDHLGADDGYIFSWGIGFDPSLYPSMWDFTPTIVSQSWSGNGVTGTNPATACPTVAGVQNYTYSVTDNYGCTYTTIVPITVSSLTITSSQTNVTCNGGANGTATITSTSGGTAPYTYTWSPAVSATNSATGLAAGTYSVTVTDANGCGAIRVFTITQPAAMTFTTSTTPANCGAPTGTATVGAVTNGTAPYTYLWAPGGQTSNPAINLAAGTYTVTVTGANGCTGTNTATVNGTGSVTAGFTSNGNHCLNGGVNSFCFTNTGTTGVTYSWTFGDGVGTSTLQNPCYTYTSTGTFTVTQTVINGSCTATSTMNVTVYANPTVTFNNTNVNCNGFCNGSSQALPVGGSGTYSYTWNDPAPVQITQTATALCAGTYNVTITDTYGCSVVGTTTITQPTALSHSAASSNCTCNGVCNGTAQVIASGGTGSYTYSWSPGGATTSNISGLCPNTYTVTIYDAANPACYQTETVIITQPAAIVLSTSAVNATCGMSNGSASVSITSGGTAPFTYAWNDPAPIQITSTATGLAAGAYTVIVTDATGCTATATVNVNDNGSPTASITAQTNVNCFGACTGSATVTLGGTLNPNFNYVWSSGSNTPGSPLTTNTASGLCAGAFSVTVTDINGCIATASGTITQPTALTATTTTVSANCGQANGSATVNPSGGTAPYTIFTWNDPAPVQTTQTATALAAGTYSVTVTDAVGCTFTTTATISDIGGITSVTMTSTNALCNGASNGTATATPAGGTAPYIYTWDDPAPVQTTQTATGLAAGTYSVTVTDLSGCIMINTVVVGQPTVVTASISAFTNITCNGLSNGTATVAPGGGTAPYTYLWAAGSSPTLPNNTGLPVGTTNVTVYDANGCTAMTSVTLTQPTAVSLTISSVNENCFQCNGSSTVVASGGTAPYTYLWPASAGSQTSATATGLCSGSYIVTVTDNQGCTATITGTVSNIPAGLATISSFTNVSCNGLCNGQATVSIGGGISPYTYQWPASAGSQTTATATNLCPGTYVPSVIDAVGCTVTSSVTITEPAALTGNLTIDHLTCHDICDGIITVNPTGGTPVYTYAWQGMLNTTPTVNSLCPGNYTVTVSDANSCTMVLNGTVNNADEIFITGVITNANCGQPDGAIDITVTGGTGPYTFTWITTATPTLEDQTGLAANNYIVVVTDSKGCTQQQTFTVGEIDGPTSLISAFTNVSCNGSCDGTATVTASGGSGLFGYQWSASAGGQLIANATNLCVGSHSVTVTDISTGCITISSVTITEPAVLAYTITDIDPECNSIYGACNGSASANIVGGTTPYTYLWSGPGLGAGASTTTVSNLCGGNYSLLITDAHGCTNLQTFTLVEPSFINLTYSTVAEQCSGACDGQAAVLPSGGTPGYTYQWSATAGGQTSQTALGLCAGTYQVTVYDDNLCAQTGSVTVTTPNPMSFVSIIVDHVDCYGNCNGSVTVNVTGGVPPYTFGWDNGSTAQNPTGLCQGVYNVTVYDDNDCFITSNVIVNQPPLLTLTTIPTNVTCYGYANGSVIANIGGGQPPYDVVWSPSGSSATTQTNLNPGTYCISITDFNGCTISDCETITGPTLLDIVNVVTNDATCGDSNGSINIGIAGGVPGYDIEWSNGCVSVNNPSIPSGCYGVTITDNNNCEADTTICINNLDGPVITGIVKTNVTCFGYSDGTATVSYTGIAPLTVEWSDGQVGDLADNLPPGNITVVVTDANGCEVSQLVNITSPALLNANINSFTNVQCYGACDGTANVFVGGGSIPYSYSWPVSGDNTATVTGLCQGVHNVIVTDINGCTATDNQLISQPAQFTVSATVTDATCFGSDNGIITIISTGGTPTHLYNWLNTGTTISTDANLWPGNHTVCITDQHGCDTCLTYVVGEPDPIAATLASEPTTCDEPNGVIYVSSVSGGTPPYSYSWSPEFTTNAAGDINSDAPDGNYVLTIYDDHNCSHVVSGTVTAVQPPIIVKIDVYNATCFGYTDGWAEAEVAMGTPPYTYNWTPTGGDGLIATGLGEGAYTFYVTDASGCVANQTIYISEPSPVNLTVSGETTICIGQSTGISAFANGGQPPYTFYWDGVPSTNTTYVVSPDALTCYDISCTDANGCPNTQPQEVCIDVYPAIHVAAMTNNPMICEGSSASIIGAATGGNGGPYEYYWSTGTSHLSTISVSPTTTTTYLVYAQDNCGSPSDSATVTIEVDYAPEINVIPDTSGCEPITVHFHNFIVDETGVSYIWNFGDPSSGTLNISNDSDPIHIYEHSGDFDVTLTAISPSGCESEATYENLIKVNEVPVADFHANPWVTTVFHSRIEFMDMSSDEVTDWYWDFGDTYHSIIENPEHEYNVAGTFPVMLVVSTEYGCIDTVIHEVIIQEEVTFWAPTAITPGNGGRNENFIVMGIGLDEETYHLYIYDRWGEVIFETTDFQQYWNGRFEGEGEFVELGTYTWLVTIRDINGVNHEFAGTVTVIR